MYFRSWDPAVSTRGGGDDNATKVTKDWLNPEKAMLVTFKDREQSLVMVWITWSWCFSNNFTSFVCEFLVWSDQISSQKWPDILDTTIRLLLLLKPRAWFVKRFFTDTDLSSLALEAMRFPVISNTKRKPLHGCTAISTWPWACPPAHVVCVCVFFGKQTINQAGPSGIKKKVNKSTKHDLNIAKKHEHCAVFVKIEL